MNALASAFGASPIPPEKTCLAPVSFSLFMLRKMSCKQLPHAPSTPAEQTRVLTTAKKLSHNPLRAVRQTVLTILFRIALIAMGGVAVLLPVPGQAQDYSVEDVLRSADWHTASPAEGITWKRAHLPSLYGLPQSLNVLDVDLDAETVTVDIAFSDTGRVKTSVLADRADAVAAVNGSFFNVSNGESVVFFQNDGQVLNDASGSMTGARQTAAVATDSGGDAVVIRKATPDWTHLARFDDVLASGPLLVWQAQAVPSGNVGFNVTHHPRTALGLTEENHLLLVTVDGRTGEAAGMTIQELAWVMQGLGASHAVNLDGGGSTTMWLRDKGIVNYPSDNGSYDHEGERTVANAVIIRVHD